MNPLDEAVKSRASNAEYLKREIAIRAVNRATIDALNIKRTWHTTTQNGVFALLRRHIEYDPKEALKLLDKMKAFDIPSHANPSEEVSDISDLSF